MLFEPSLEQTVQTQEHGLAFLVKLFLWNVNIRNGSVDYLHNKHTTFIATKCLAYTKGGMIDYMYG